MPLDVVFAPTVVALITLLALPRYTVSSGIVLMLGPEVAVEILIFGAATATAIDRALSSLGMVV